VTGGAYVRAVSPLAARINGSSRMRCLARHAPPARCGDAPAHRLRSALSAKATDRAGRPAQIAEIALIGKGVEKSASDGGPHLPSQIALIAEISLGAARRSQKPLSEIALIRAASPGHDPAGR